MSTTATATATATTSGTSHPLRRHTGHPPSSQPMTTTTSTSTSASTSTRPPRTLEDLTVIARNQVNWDTRLGVSYWLGEAERHRANSQTHGPVDADLVFLDLVKSTNILYSLREHPEYVGYLDAEARETMRKVCSSLDEGLLIRELIGYVCRIWKRCWIRYMILT